MHESILRQIGRKTVCVVASLALAASMTVALPALTTQAQAADADDYVTASANRAGEVAPEILGITNVTTFNQWGDYCNLDWSTPYTYFFGTDYNTNPNPRMVNALLNDAAGETLYTPYLFINSDRSGNPNSSLGTYENATDTWNCLPDIIFGNSSNVNYNSEEYSVAAAEANNASDYKTYGAGDDEGTGDYGVQFLMTDVYDLITTMYNLAEAGEAAAEGTGKSLRYGSATEIAADYEAYVKGTQGYILEQLEAEGKDKKTVCLITAYDSSTDTFTLQRTYGTDGTAANNRYIEATAGVAYNLADELDADEAGTTATATREQVEGCDLIMIGSQTGDDDSSLSALSSDALEKAYWTTATSIGSCYGVTMNCVENAQNTGRILGCLYSEYIDQSDWMAYYYQNFYHLKTDTLAEVMDNALDGIRNWNANGSSQSATAWSESDVSDYVESNVQLILNEGMAYCESLGDDAGDLAPTTEFNLYRAADTYELPSDDDSSDAVDSGSTTTAKKAQSIKVKAKKASTVKYSKLKKKAQSVKASKLYKVTGAKGKLSYSKVSVKKNGKKASSKVAKKITVNKKTGKITLKKGLAKGTYKVKVKVKAAATSKYKASKAKTVTVTIKVK